MVMHIPLLEQGPKFSAKEAKQLRKQFWKDREFRNTFFCVRNAWMLHKISVELAVKYCKKALKKSLKKTKKK